MDNDLKTEQLLLFHTSPELLVWNNKSCSLSDSTGSSEWWPASVTQNCPLERRSSIFDVRFVLLVYLFRTHHRFRTPRLSQVGNLEYIITEESLHLGSFSVSFAREVSVNLQLAACATIESQIKSNRSFRRRSFFSTWGSIYEWKSNIASSYSSDSGRK